MDEIKALASLDLQHSNFAEKHCIPDVTTDYRILLSDPEIDIARYCHSVDQHMSMILQSLEAGKHVICEKPLLGIAVCGDVDPISKTVSKHDYV